MELIKKNIHMNRQQCRSEAVLSLSDDINVPDIKPDVSAVIKIAGEFIIEEQKAVNGRLYIRGAFKYQLLYVSDDQTKPINGMNGQISFDEAVYSDNALNGENVHVRLVTDDISCLVINSRKLSVKAKIRAYISLEELYDEESIADVKDEADIQLLKKELTVTNITVSKKDACRFKEEITLPASKGTISELLYAQADLKNIDIRLLNDKFSAKGEVAVFIVYSCAGEDNPFEYYEADIPFVQIIDCEGIDENMIPNISVVLNNKSFNVKTDGDGEERIIETEAVADYNIKIYNEESFDVVKDMYSPVKPVIPQMKEAVYENLLLKNSNKVRITDKIKIAPDAPKVLQICHAGGTVNIENVRIKDEGLAAEGYVEAGIFYISADDDRPLYTVKQKIPFIQEVDVKGITQDNIYEIEAAVEQVNVIMLDADEMETKVSVVLNVVVFDRINEKFVCGVETAEKVKTNLRRLPLMTGYIVSGGETLWDIAKAHSTTIEEIRQMNQIEGEEIKAGDRLLIVRKV